MTCKQAHPKSDTPCSPGESREQDRSKRKHTHIIWDFNGTLLDDVGLCIRVVGGMLEERGLPSFTDVDDYHRVFGFPVIDYYRRAGFDFEKESFAALADIYMERYRQGFQDCSLYPGTVGVLDAVKKADIRQVILSASKREDLLFQTESLGITGYFDEILGIEDHYAHGKSSLGKAFIAERRIPGENILFVGDTVHDYEVAGEMGCDCLLVASGHQSRETLMNTGGHTVNSITDVLEFEGLKA